MTIFVNCRQGTPEWLQARAGVCTASEVQCALSTVGGLNEQQKKFVDSVLKDGMSEKDAAVSAGYKAVPKSDIIARALRGEPTEEPSGASLRYAADLALERISGVPYGEPPKSWILERGHQMEELARIRYESMRHVMVLESGIALTDDRRFGYSTDGYVDDDGCVEIKCPIDSTKILDMWRTGDVSEYRHQIMTGLWISGRKWCDLIMYVPALERVGNDMYIQRIYRDDNFIDQMVEGLLKFDQRVEEYVSTFSQLQREAA